MTASLAVLPFTMIPTVSQAAYAVLAYLCIRAALVFWEWLRVHHMISKLPTLPVNDVVLGNLVEATSTGFHRWFKANSDTYGGIYAYRALHRHGIIVTDPELCHEISRSAAYDKSLMTYKTLNVMMSDKGHSNLVTAQTASPQWKLVRKAIMPAFSTNNIRHGFGHVVGVVGQLAKILEEAAGEGKVIDMGPLLQRLALDVIGLVGFGFDMGAVKAATGAGAGKVGNALETTCAAALEVEKRWNEPFWAWKLWKREVQEGKAALGKYLDIMRALLTDVHDRAAAGQLLESSVAGHLLRVKQPGSSAGLSDDLLLPEIAVLFFAGEDTTSHTTAWTLYQISQHPEVEAKIVAELEQAGLLATPARPQPRALQHSDLSKLTYLNMVIKESMRILPVAFGTAREVRQDTTLAGKYRIPKDVIIILPQYTIHNSWRNWEEPDRFLPERWLVPDAEYAVAGLTSDSTIDDKIEAAQAGAAAGEVAKHPDADDYGDARREARPKRFLPFSDGHRSCAGLMLANMSLTTTLALLYGRFSFQLAKEMGGVEGVRKAEHLALTLFSEKGMKMNPVPRVPA